MSSQTDSILAGLMGANTWSGHGMNVRRVRDLIISEIGQQSLVIACDSNAATGDKPGDFLKQSPTVTGYSAAKVPLMEVLAAGADPFLLIDNLCCDLATTGLQLLRGIHTLLQETGIDVMITGSDESNMPTVQTGIGVTLIGIAETAKLRVGTVRGGDEIWVIGSRRSGLEGDRYQEGIGGIATALHVKQARTLDAVHEILPVGSKGVAVEAGELARIGNVRIEFDSDLATDLHASAGASTCFLVACAAGTSRELDLTGLPRELIGRARDLDPRPAEHN